MTEQQMKRQHAIDEPEAAATIYVRRGNFSQEGMCRVAVRMIHMGKLNQAHQTVEAINACGIPKCPDGAQAFNRVETSRLCLESLINQRGMV